jgi:hypothetical protein
MCLYTGPDLEWKSQLAGKSSLWALAWHAMSHTLKTSRCTRSTCTPGESDSKESARTPAILSDQPKPAPFGRPSGRKELQNIVETTHLEKKTASRMKTDVRVSHLVIVELVAGPGGVDAGLVQHLVRHPVAHAAYHLRSGRGKDRESGDHLTPYTPVLTSSSWIYKCKLPFIPINPVLAV